MLDEPIERLSQFTEFVEALPKEFILSRGQEKEYELLPGALRLDNNKKRKYSRGSIQYFLNEFKVNCHNYVKQPIDIRDDYEWMVYAQHYGIPTKLLDFTHSHVVSLMFAVENSFHENEECDAEVWFLNPLELNYKFASRSDINNISNGERINLDNFDGPIAFKARKLNERINAQNGLFVYFQDNCQPLSDLKDENIIRRLVIKGECKKDILSSLYSMGIGYTTLYPELESVTKDIIMKKSILEYVRDGE
ncbi:FRG domain-containing protein [Bacillus velezensis]|uniref:FRG domain-containing protein n=1 Tax=Bacillus velezensis TaxID=492670 RepID=UPI0015C45035|nr:FRG domain-containing protein [Bacillus velezensis]QLG05642.1 FRG domain-containing protein [Bacillus velezensis]